MKKYCVDGYIESNNKRGLERVLMDMCLTNIDIDFSRNGISFYKNCFGGALVMCIDIKTGLSPDGIRKSFNRFLARQKIRALRDFEFFVWEKI